VGGHAVPEQLAQRRLLFVAGALALPIPHAVQTPGQRRAFLGAKGVPRLATHRDDPALVAVPAEREVQVDPGELLGADLLERRRAAAHHALGVEPRERIRPGPPAPDVEGAQLHLRDGIVAQEDKLHALERARVRVGEVTGHHV